MKTGLVSSLEFKKHLTGLGHPESPKRVDAVLRAIEAAGIEEKLLRIDPRKALKEDLERVHSAAYVARAEADVALGARQLSTGDTNVCEASYEIALLSAGGILQGVDAVMGGKVANAFCVV